jgi:hypothetical protein
VAVFIPVYKIGDKNMCENYRISVQVTASKILTAIIKQKLRILEPRIEGNSLNFEETNDALMQFSQLYN